MIGYEEVFVKLDRDALEDYYRQRYQPENIVVVVGRQSGAGRSASIHCRKNKGIHPKADGTVGGAARTRASEAQGGRRRGFPWHG